MNRKLYSLDLINDEKLMTFKLGNFEVHIIPIFIFQILRMALNDF